MNANTKHTPTPWHVNAVDSRRGRIVGDETAESGTWDKLTINSHNRTVATVYRPADARAIVRAVNAHSELVAALRALTLAISENDPALILAAHADASAALEKAEGGQP